MARVCAWCLRAIDPSGGRPPEPAALASHGVCAECARALCEGSAPLPRLPGAELATLPGGDGGEPEALDGDPEAEG